MSLLVACPVILPPRTDVVASWTHRPHLLIINGAHSEWLTVIDPAVNADRFLYTPCDEGNRGVAASWNLALKSAQRRSIDYVALVSQSLLIDGGTARLAELVEQHADERGLLTDHAWHCIVLSVACYEQLGPFDENFSPAYYEDSDMVRRMFLAGVHTPSHPMRKVGPPEFVATCETAATLRAGLIDAGCYERNRLLYERKWGGPPFHETYARPYDPTSVGEASNWASEEP